MTKLTNITLNLPFSLELNTGFLAYCAGLDPARDWDLGGVSGYDDDSDDLDIGAINEFVRALSAGENPPRHHLVSLAVQMFNEYWHGEPVIEKHFPDHEFIFVVGPPRTGGTFLLTQLYKASGLDHRRLNRLILRDTIPRTRHLARGRADPKKEINGLFELFQFLAWAKESIPTKTVVQKNTRYTGWMHVLDPLFGARARYAVTVRPPLATVASFLQWVCNDRDWRNLLSRDDSDFQAPATPGEMLDFYGTSHYASAATTEIDVILANWETHYRDVVQLPLAGKIDVFTYGDPMVDFFTTHYPAYLETEPTGLPWTPDDRDYDALAVKFGIDAPALQDRIDAMGTYWAEQGLRFPNLSAI